MLTFSPFFRALSICMGICCVCVSDLVYVVVGVLCVVVAAPLHVIANQFLNI